MATRYEAEVKAPSELETERSYPLLYSFAVCPCKDNGMRLSKEWEERVKDQARRIRNEWIAASPYGPESLGSVFEEVRDLSEDANLFHKQTPKAHRDSLLKVLLLIGYDLGRDDLVLAVRNAVIGRLTNLYVLNPWGNSLEATSRKQAVLEIMLKGANASPLAQNGSQNDAFKDFIESKEFGHTREKPQTGFC